MTIISKIINFIWRCLGTFQLQCDSSKIQKTMENTYLKYLRDGLIDLFMSERAPNKEQIFFVKTEFPVALKSPDYFSPTGFKEYCTTRSQRFVCSCERIFKKKPIKHIDIGCGRGGITLDFLLRHHISIGLDGSDCLSIAAEREWDILGNKNLFTADACQKYEIFYKDKNQDGVPGVFHADIITAFELLEHLPESRLDGFFKNILFHLDRNGLFVCSVSYGSYVLNGVEHHLCRHPKSWWLKKLDGYGFIESSVNPFHPYDFPRGCEPGYDFVANPSLGCHLILKKK